MEQYFNNNTFNITNNIEEYELEKELEREKIFMEDDINNTMLNDINAIYDLVINNSIYETHINTIKYSQIINNNIFFEISRIMDVIQNIYLVIDLENIDDYDNIITRNFLNSQIKINIGSKTLFDYTLLICIFEAKLKGYEIIIEDNKMQIPLFIIDFNIPIDNNTKINGFPIISVPYECIALTINTDSDTKYLFKNIVQQGLSLNSKYRRHIARTKYENIILHSKIQKYDNLLNNNNILNISNYTFLKALIFVFYPKHDDIDGIELISGHINNIELEQYITKIKLFNTFIYVFSFSREFNNIENMQNLFRYKQNYITNNGLLSCKINNFNLEIQTTEDMKDYELDVITINLNSIMIQQGISDYKYIRVKNNLKIF